MASALDTRSVQSIADQIDVLVRSRTPLISVATTEEGRCLRIIQDVAGREKHAHKPLFVWSRVAGLFQTAGPGVGVAPRAVAGDLQPAQVVIDSIRACATAVPGGDASDPQGIFVLLDFAQSLAETFGDEKAILLRSLRELAREAKESRVTVFFVDPQFPEVESLRDDLTRIELPRPDEDEVRAIVGMQLAGLPDDPRLTAGAQDDTDERLIEAFRGLTEAQIESSLARCIITCRGINEDAVRVAFAAKRDLVRSIPSLELTAPEPVDSFGGYPHIIAYLHDVKLAMSPEARAFGVLPPRGLLLIGPPGNGKTFIARVASFILAQNLWTFSIGELLGAGGSLIGSAELAMKELLGIVSTAGGILLVDEYEKATGGLASSAQTDGGTMARVLARFLTFMAQQRSNFIIATANDVRTLRPEQTREGRFSRVIFVDTPKEADRVAILRVHLAKRGQDPARADLAEVAGLTERFSGAELEAVVEGAHYDCFKDGTRVVTTDHLARRAGTINPIAVVQAEQVDEVRRWAENTGLLLPETPPAVRPSVPVGKRSRALEL